MQIVDWVALAFTGTVLGYFGYVLHKARELGRAQRCPNCQGSGEIPAVTRRIRCGPCKGRGYFPGLD